MRRQNPLLPLVLSALVGGCLTWVPPEVSAPSGEGSAPDNDGDGFSVDLGDCDDFNADVFPGAEETCNEVDDDCDGTTDEGVIPEPFRPDADGDGYPSPNPSLEWLGCAAPEGYLPAEQPFDCADSLPEVYPGATEVCDGIDQDCNGVLDDDVTQVLFRDGDGDGYGAAEPLGVGCPGNNFSFSNDDCDDQNENINPGDGDGDGLSGCDGDCDDTNASIVPGEDNDQDGHSACVSDCDDGNADIFSGALEVCNQIDDDCDGTPDNGLGTSLVIGGADLAQANQVQSLLSDSGFCTAPMMNVNSLSSSTSFAGIALIVVTADTGSPEDWDTRLSSLYNWYWETEGLTEATPAALIGMGLGGLGLFEALNVDSSLTFGGTVQEPGGVAQAENPSNTLWSVPNQLLTFNDTLTVYTGDLMTTRPLTSVTNSMMILASTTAGNPLIVYTPVLFDGVPRSYYWGFSEGLNLATAQGKQLFENLVYDAIGPP